MYLHEHRFLNALRGIVRVGKTEQEGPNTGILFDYVKTMVVEAQYFVSVVLFQNSRNCRKKWLISTVNTFSYSKISQ